MSSGSFLIVDKPSGVTSHDVVAGVRRATGVRKCGHAGTLDPMATGVVVVAVGSVTRLIRYVQDAEKEYLASAVFGVATDTLDADGEEIERKEMNVDQRQVENAARGFIGEIEQVPPMVSALKHHGRRLYELAREGIEVERRSRTVFIDEFEITATGPPPHPVVDFRVVCGKGTYVRVLADDLARACGGRAHLVALRRTRIGGLGLDRAISLEGLDRWEEAALTPAAALGHLPAVTVDADVAPLVQNGRRVEVATTGHEVVRVLDETGRLLAVSRPEGGRLVPEVVVPQ